MRLQSKSYTCAVWLAAADEGAAVVAAWRSRLPCKQANGVKEAGCTNTSFAVNVTKTYQRAQWS
jgi:hypothetical protein